MKKGKFTLIMILFVLWILFLFVLYRYGEVFQSNPFAYGAKKYGVDCICFRDSSTIYITREGEITTNPISLNFTLEDE
jgi:hypothetical protein